jgi:phospholipid/cholesterol/gamma-HCH transport system substrate-binding protein
MIKKINFEFILGVFILLFSLFAFIYLFNKFSLFEPSNDFELESSFLDIAGLKVGSDVKINGVKVGEVGSISLDSDTYMAIVKTYYNNYINIPSDSSFKISNNGFIGSPYIEILLGSSSSFYENNDSTINNIDAISLEEVINNFIFK